MAQDRTAFSVTKISGLSTLCRKPGSQNFEIEFQIRTKWIKRGTTFCDF